MLKLTKLCLVVVCSEETSNLPQDREMGKGWISENLKRSQCHATFSLSGQLLYGSILYIFKRQRIIVGCI